ncbi:MAG: DUF2924 domain-containing protein [Hyphomonadaceae bacterium]|nr:DUF2924 domain-containing protein [Hyphomonadaceae bacterium]
MPERFDVRALDDMNIAQLRRAWMQQLAEPLPPLRAPELLRRELAWRLEARIYGDIDARLRQRLDQRSKPTGKRGKQKVRTAATPVGTTLVREWDGIPYSVVVLKEGYLFKGETFRSLSQIARQITGVHWSGPRFFGLQGKAP